MPLVSIIMPVYNGEKTITRSLESIKSQTFRDFETILVDNNCTDSSIRIANQFAKDINLRVVKCTYPGIVAALNTGMSAARGELFARQDADDYWYPEKLEKQVRFLEDNPDISILGTQIRLLDEEGNVEDIGTFDIPVNYPADDNRIKCCLLLGENPICHPSVVFRRGVLVNVGGYENLFPLAEDLHLWCRCIPYAKFANLPDTLVDYTQTRSEKYDARIPLLIGRMYYDLYRKFGWVEGERPKRIYNWQMKQDGHKHEK